MSLDVMGVAEAVPAEIDHIAGPSKMVTDGDKRFAHLVTAHTALTSGRCQRCGGQLLRDAIDELACLQCGGRYYL